MEIAQSYYSVLIRHRFSIYEQRVMLRIIERCSEYVKPQGRYRDHITKPYDVSGLSHVFVLSLQSLVGSKSHNYKPLRNAITGLQSVIVEFWAPHYKLWRAAPLIKSAEIDGRQGTVTIELSSWLVGYITDFGCGGYRYYELEHAFALRNVFASRLYQIVSSQSKPILYDVAQLKKVLGVDAAAYAKVSDFCRRVLQPAKKELDKNKYNSFSYEVVRRAKGAPKSEPVAVKLTPIHREQAEKLTTEERTKLLYDNVSLSLIGFLKSKLSFTDKELTSNRAALAAFCSLPGWQDMLLSIYERARRKQKGKGYMIGAFKLAVKEHRQQQQQQQPGD